MQSPRCFNFYSGVVLFWWSQRKQMPTKLKCEGYKYWKRKITRSKRRQRYGRKLFDDHYFKSQSGRAGRSFLQPRHVQPHYVYRLGNSKPEKYPWVAGRWLRKWQNAYCTPDKHWSCGKKNYAMSLFEQVIFPLEPTSLEYLYCTVGTRFYHNGRPWEGTW